MSARTSVSVVACLLLAACGGGAEETPEGSTGAGTATASRGTTTTGGGTAGGATAVMAMDISDAVTADPAESYETGSGLMVRQTYDTLVDFEGEEVDHVVPALAASWDLPTAGDGKWTFHLDPNATFHDGSPVTAEDVVYSFQRALALELTPVWLLQLIGFNPDTATAVDSHTVEMTFDPELSPDIILSILTFPVAGIVSKAMAEEHANNGDYGHEWVRSNSAGSGPYVLSAWERDSRMEFTANPSYWRPAPQIGRAVVQHVPESETQSIMLESGDIDISANVNPEQRDSLEGAGMQIVPVKVNVLIYLGMNVTHEAFANEQVRTAVKYAIDYNGLINDVLGGAAIFNQGILPDGFLGSDTSVAFEYDPERAKQLLSDAGYPDGFSVEFTVPTGADVTGVANAEIAAKIQSDLAAVGITAEIQQLAGATLLERYRAQGLQLVLMYWGADYPDPDANAKAFGDDSVKQLAYRNAWHDDAIVQLVQSAAKETDRGTREQMYTDIVHQIQERGPFVILYQPTRNYAVSPKIQNFIVNPQAGLRFSDFQKQG